MSMENTLKTGFTTGTAAAAAAKGALKLLLTGHIPEKVEIRLLTGDTISIPIHSAKFSENQAICTVIKDAGDDPDVTHRAEIGAKCKMQNAKCKMQSVVITGGKGVGRVTKPGLEIPPGQPAINPGPRKMICQAIQDVLIEHCVEASVSAEIFVPEGERIAQKTLNARLGILGGISILGTTGIVKPMSHDAYIASIVSALSVAKASGLETIVLTTGRRSERYAQLLWKDLPEEAFVQMGDFFKAALESASEKGFKQIRLAVFFGKALKMAQGFPHTHASKSEMTMQSLAENALALTHDADFAEELRFANTARHALQIIGTRHSEIISWVGQSVISSARRFCMQNVMINIVIFDYDGKIIFDR
jgi:cobalt-precorrin-5B (C1)-methyltransferase